MEMTENFDVIEEILESIGNGTYGMKIDDLYVLDCCRDLGEEAEIFTALHPDKAAAYLTERKAALYKIITRVVEEMLKVEPGQRLQLEFVEVGLVKLYKFHTDLLK